MSSNKTALITGVTGQDGSYLAELLLEKGYDVHGIIRRSSSFNTGRIEHLFEDPHTKSKHFTLHYGDLTDSSNICTLLQEIKPDEIYNLAAQSHVKVSFELPEYTAQVDGLGTLRILNAMRAVGIEKTCRMYQASTSELYGKVQEVPQSEKTPFYPRSPYGVAKLYSYWMMINYREAYDMHLTNGILFNHESPRRGATFVTRKITRAVARIVKGIQKCLYLGNLNSRRDWGHAKDYVEAMWIMLQQERPNDYVCATGEMHTVREFVELAFKTVGITLIWKGSGSDEKGYHADNLTDPLVQVDPRYYRPTEVEQLLGDPTKAKTMLNWEAQTKFADLVSEMVLADVTLVEAGNLVA